MANAADPNELPEAVFELEAAANEIIPFLERLDGLLAMLDENGGNFPQHVPKEFQMKIDDLYNVHQSAERTFFRYSQLYPKMKDEWITGTYQQWKMTMTRGYRAVLAEKYGLLRKSAAFLRAKASMPVSTLPTSPTSVTNYFGGNHTNFRDVITMNNEKGVMVGPHAIVEQSNLTVSTHESAPLDLSKLALELAEVRKRMRAVPDTSAEHDAAMGQIALAETAAKQGNKESVWKHLKQAGQVALDFAAKVGEGLAVEALKSSMGIPSGSPK